MKVLVGKIRIFFSGILGRIMYFLGEMPFLVIFCLFQRFSWAILALVRSFVHYNTPMATVGHWSHSTFSPPPRPRPLWCRCGRSYWDWPETSSSSVWSRPSHSVSASVWRSPLSPAPTISICPQSERRKVEGRLIRRCFFKKATFSSYNKWRGLGQSKPH